MENILWKLVNSMWKLNNYQVINLFMIRSCLGLYWVVSWLLTESLCIGIMIDSRLNWREQRRPPWSRLLPPTSCLLLGRWLGRALTRPGWWPWTWLKQAELLLVDREHSSSCPAIILVLMAQMLPGLGFVTGWTGSDTEAWPLSCNNVIFFHLSLLP